MSRHLLLAAFLGLSVTGVAEAQAELGDAKSAAVVELFEDDTAFFIENLHNHGAKDDGSTVGRSEQTAFSGVCSLSVTPFQRFNTRLPGWKYPIAKEPEAGEFRYLRFAWKRSEAPGIMLQIHAQPKIWHRYYAGTLTEKIQAWGAMTRVADDVPRQWELVTRDLFADFGPMTITGISFSAMSGGGAAYYDHIYLGRTVEDLDRVTAAKKNAGNVPPLAPAPALVPAAELATQNSWLVWVIVGVVLISLLGFLGLAFLLWLRAAAQAPARSGEKPRAAK